MSQKFTKWILKNWSFIAETIVVIWAILGLRKVAFDFKHVIFRMEGIYELVEHTDPILMGMLFYLFSAVLMICLIRRLAKGIKPR